ncbi:glycosyltransferase [Rhizobium sp. SGZ-381]|uniref:glycosyltransferase n=1 Tax=Rhizobium sp. SGZ-381 TaxID=3342800 RepID=UPI00366DCBBD
MASDWVEFTSGLVRMQSERRPFAILHVISTVDRKGGGPIEGVFQAAATRDPKAFTTHIASLDAPASEAVRTSPVLTHALGEGQEDTGWRRRLPWRRYGYQPKFVPWLKANARNYDIVVVDGLWNYATFGARRALVGSGVPYVVFTHGMLDPWFKRTYPLKAMLKQLFWLFSEGPLLNNARAVLFTTEEEKIVSRDAFAPYRVRERVVGFGTADIPGDAGAQEAAFRAAVPALNGKRYLLFLSRIHPKKGCDLLVEAFGRIAAEHPDLDLVIAGPDQMSWRQELEARARALGVADRIHWPGMLIGDTKWGAFRGCEAFVLPSHQENFGVVVAEAMAAEKPVLLTEKVNIWREVVACGGGLAESDTIEGVTRLLTNFLALPTDRRAAMGVAARGGFLAHFEISRAAANINLALKEATS